MLALLTRIAEALERAAPPATQAPDEAEDDAAEAARRIWSALDIWFASGEGRSRLP